MSLAVSEGSVAPTPPRCAFKGCDKPRRGDFCVGHANQRAKGHQLVPLRKLRLDWSEEDRFWDRVDLRDFGGCWNWLACKRGTFPLNKIPKESRSRTVMAYRYSYSFFHPDENIDGVTIHHTCANRQCVNPAHLQAISNINNVAEMNERQHYLRRIAALEERVAELESRLKGCE